MNERTVLLIGENAFSRLQSSFVIVAGLGGVGGHCAEALARAGVGRLHIVDFDTVSESNRNRQLIAAKSTLGQKKTAAMQQRLTDVSDCLVTASDVKIDEMSVSALPADAAYVVDAIDDLRGKLALIQWARDTGVPVLSCLGAGNRRDASRFCVKDIFDTAGDPLARRLRAELRKRGIDRLDAVFSDEAPHTSPGQTVIGSLAPVTAAAGLVAASFVIAKLTGDDFPLR